VQEREGAARFDLGGFVFDFTLTLEIEVGWADGADREGSFQSFSLKENAKEG
jgi:hypothetical protein